ncbi:unnamed protein product [Acanthosepion pharaonis]|uniref:C2H2-type domain-containing protein n=1 Tax=Acanthosepion pharaonis TaxID=158019 RepID=A0A812DE56_ACAPH|nr:unnamed protein product [Sepia pharaonis]
MSTAYSFRGGPHNNFFPPPLHVNSQGPPIPARGPRDPSLAGVPPMLGPPGNLDSIPGRTNFGRGDRLSMGIPERGPLRNRDFAPSPPREMRRDYRNESHDYERSGLLPHDYDSYRNYGPHDFSGPPSGNYSFYGPSSTNAHFNFMPDQKMQADEPGGYAIPFHAANNATDLYPSPNPQIPYNMPVNKLPTKRKAQAQPFSCNVCNVNFNSEQQASQHFNSVRHVKKMRLMEPGNQIKENKEGDLLDAAGEKHGLSKKQVFTCECCKITVNSLHQLDAHKSGSKHQAKLTQMETSNEMETEDDPVGGSDNTSQNAVSFDKKSVFSCVYCNISVNSLQQLDAHKSGQKHQSKMQQMDPDKQMEMDEDPIESDVNNLPLPPSSFDKKTVFTCEYCKITVNSLHQLEAHKNGNKHQSKVSQMEPGMQMENKDSVMNVSNNMALPSSFDKKGVFTCECCNVTVNSLQQLEAHKSGQKHQSKLLQMDPDKQMETNFVTAINNLKLPVSSEKKQSFTCVYCNISVNSLQQLEAHMSGNKHQAKLQKAQEEN